MIIALNQNASFDWHALLLLDTSRGACIYCLICWIPNRLSQWKQKSFWLLATQYCLDNEHFEQARSFLGHVEAHHDVEQNHSFSGWYWQSQAVLSHHEQRLGEASQSFLRAKRQTPDSEILRMGSILSDALCYTKHFRSQRLPMLDMSLPCISFHK